MGYLTYTITIPRSHLKIVQVILKAPKLSAEERAELPVSVGLKKVMRAEESTGIQLVGFRVLGLGFRAQGCHVNEFDCLSMCNRNAFALCTCHRCHQELLNNADAQVISNSQSYGFLKYPKPLPPLVPKASNPEA